MNIPLEITDVNSLFFFAVADLKSITPSNGAAVDFLYSMSAAAPAAATKHQDSRVTLADFCPFWVLRFPYFILAHVICCSSFVFGFLNTYNA
jgi:hypothetical protein